MVRAGITGQRRRSDSSVRRTFGRSVLGDVFSAIKIRRHPLVRATTIFIIVVYSSMYFAANASGPEKRPSLNRWAHQYECNALKSDGGQMKLLSDAETLDGVDLGGATRITRQTSEPHPVLLVCTTSRKVCLECKTFQIQR
jgi:hypothetical protein